MMNFSLPLHTTLAQAQVTTELSSDSSKAHTFLSRSRSKSIFLLLSVCLLAACGDQGTTSTSTGTTKLVGQSNAQSQATENTSLLASLAKEYPNGQLPAASAAQAAKALSQNPSVFKSSGALVAQAGASSSGQNIRPHAFTATDFNPVYRIQNTTLSGSYFFTIYDFEKTAALAANPNWKLEGTAFYTLPAASTDLSPVYRFRNKLNGSYLYTAYESEKTDIETNYGATFELEGVAWRAQQTPAPGYSPLYRFRNLVNGTYLNSAYESEKDAIVAQYPDIFKLEGIAYYVVTANPQTAGEAMAIATNFLMSLDALRATSVPATGLAAWGNILDNCFLNNGYSKQYLIAEYDANPLTISSRQFETGSTRTGITVLADRETANPDGTGRRELDLKYVVNYLDGTKDENARETLILGSSSGSKMADGTICATPQQSATARFLGNRRIVSATLGAENDRTEKVSLSLGSIKTPAITYSKYVSINLRDPANVITYATISGPGLVIAGSPATFKLVSPRLLRDAPEFLGKNGHNVDWKDTDTFRVCRVAPGNGSFASAETADCVTSGATSNTYGFLGIKDPITIDTSFDALGFVAGGVYTFKLYASDGWKTVNGQAGVTPLATYASTLENLPMSAVALAGTNTELVYPAVSATNKFHIANSATVLPFQQAQAFRTKTALTVPMQWNAPGTMPDGRAVAMSFFYSFVNGSTPEVSSYATSRQVNPMVFLSTATTGTMQIPVPLAPLQNVFYGQISVEYSNRNGNTISSIRTFD